MILTIENETFFFIHIPKCGGTSISESLSKKELNLREKEVEVLAQTKEVQRHLDDMRAWYRNKIKDLSGTLSSSLTSGYFDNAINREEINQVQRLSSIIETIEPPDKKLGDQLAGDIAEATARGGQDFLTGVGRELGVSKAVP